MLREWLILRTLISIYTLYHFHCQKRHDGEIFWLFRFRKLLAFFLIFHLTRWLRTAALASLLFDPLGPQNIGKTQCFAPCLLFARLHLLSSNSFSSLICSLLLFPSLLFHLSLLSEVWLLNFLRITMMYFGSRSLEGILAGTSGNVALI